MTRFSRIVLARWSTDELLDEVERRGVDLHDAVAERVAWAIIRDLERDTNVPRHMSRS